ncbi:MAG: HAD family hydrolase [Methanobacteriaceae archaeon]
MKNKAIVFDNSGTLLRRCRSVKDMDKGILFDDTSSLDIVDIGKDMALVVFQADTKNCFLKSSPDTKIYDFIKKYDIKCDISYSKLSYTDAEIVDAIKHSNVKMKEIQDTARCLKRKHDSIQLCSGSAIIFDMKTNKARFAVTAGGQLFPKAKETVKQLTQKGFEIFIASGDRKDSLYEVAELLEIPRANVFDTSDTNGKQEIIKGLKENFNVTMVGNGPNDILAFKEADLAILTTEQNEKIADFVYNDADLVISTIDEILDLDI